MSLSSSELAKKFPNFKPIVLEYLAARALCLELEEQMKKSGVYKNLEALGYEKGIKALGEKESELGTWEAFVKMCELEMKLLDVAVFESNALLEEKRADEAIFFDKDQLIRQGKVSKFLEIYLHSPLSRTQAI